MKSEIIISLKDQAVGSKEQSNQKGIIPVRRPLRRLARRNSKTGIRFFDLGVKGGSSIVRQYIPLWDEADLEIVKAGLTDLYREIELQIFDVNLNDFETTFELIEKGGIQGEVIAFSTDNIPLAETLNETAIFNSSVLRVASDEIDSLIISPSAGFSHASLFYPFNLAFNDLSLFTITKEPDPESTPSTFSASSHMDIYIAPGVVYNFSTANYFIYPPDDDSEVWYDSLNQFYQTLDRGAVQSFFNSFIKYEDYEGLNYTYYQFYAYAQFLKTLPNSRLQKQIFIAPSYHYYFEPGSSFLTEPCFNHDQFLTSVGDVEYWLASGSSVITDASLYDVKKLIYIIKQNSEWFYFWR